MNNLKNQLHCGDDKCNCARNQAVSLIESMEAGIVAAGNLAADIRELAKLSEMMGLTRGRGLVPTHAAIKRLSDLEKSVQNRVSTLLQHAPHEQPWTPPMPEIKPYKGDSWL